MTKKEIREQYKTIRLGIPEKEARSRALMQKILLSSHYKKAKVIGVFASMKEEVDTTTFILQAWQDHKTVAFPKIEGGNLAFYTASSFGELKPSGTLGIREPIASPATFVSKEHFDLILVPGLCFDVAHHRLGYGKGFYDRYLLGSKAYTMGLCFEEQRYSGKLPVTPYDVAVDDVISA